MSPKTIDSITRNCCSDHARRLRSASQHACQQWQNHCPQPPQGQRTADQVARECGRQNDYQLSASADAGDCAADRQFRQRTGHGDRQRSQRWPATLSQRDPREQTLPLNRRKWLPEILRILCFVCSQPVVNVTAPDQSPQLWARRLTILRMFFDSGRKFALSGCSHGLCFRP